MTWLKVETAAIHHFGIRCFTLSLQKGRICRLALNLSHFYLTKALLLERGEEGQGEKESMHVD